MGSRKYALQVVFIAALVISMMLTFASGAGAATPTPGIFVAPGPGGGPNIRDFDVYGGGPYNNFNAYGGGFSGGVFVASGDVNGDGFDEFITGPGAGGGPHVKIFSGATGSELGSFFAYDAGWRGGVHVAAGDVNGDGSADVIVGPGPGGGPHVKIFRNGDPGVVLHSLFVYDPWFAGGVWVSSFDKNADGKDELIVGAGPGGGPNVRVLNLTGGVTTLATYFAYDPWFAGGVRVAGAMN